MMGRQLNCHPSISGRISQSVKEKVDRVNILLATSEAVPFAKTGGLADVCGRCRSS